MKKLLKISVTIIMVMAMMLCATVGTFAAVKDEPEIQPLWESLAHIEFDITFTGSSPNAYLLASKHGTATYIEGTLTVYEMIDGDWYYVDSASDGKAMGTLALSIDFTAISGRQYKQEITVTAYTGTKAETETFENIETCP